MTICGNMADTTTLPVLTPLPRLVSPTLRRGGLVWVTGDQVVDGDVSGTSFTHALGFKALGLKFHQPLIYQRRAFHGRANAYCRDFDYMFVFSKGTPKSVNLLNDKRNKKGGVPAYTGGFGQGGRCKTNLYRAKRRHIP